MGFFSWKTADTKEDILNVHTGKHKTVYLLQPDGMNIEEVAYNGYGEFGNTSAYEWLAKNSVKLEVLNKAKKLNIPFRTLGIYMNDKYYIDTNTGLKYSYMLSELFDDLHTFDNYNSKIDGHTINSLIESKRFEEHSLEDYLGKIKYPLKFSFNKNAKYNELPMSVNAENQGFFLEEDEDE